MSEQTETSAQDVPVRKQNKSSSGGGAVFLALLIALAAGGASYYLWQQQLGVMQQLQQLKQQQTQQSDVLAQGLQRQAETLAQQSAQAREPIQQRLSALELALPELRRQRSELRLEWDSAEADYLLRLAEHRLNLAHDIPSAVAALDVAALKLSLQDGDDFSDVISQIKEKRQQLQQLKGDGRTHLIATLGTLSAGLESLPFAITSASAELPETAPAETDTAPSSIPPSSTGSEQVLARLQQWSAMVWRDLRDLVTIRRSDEVQTPPLVGGQRYFVQQNLRLRLETARLAVVSGDQGLYQDSLREAQAWLQRYYDGEASEVVVLRETLEEVATQTINPPLPGLGELREALQRAVSGQATGEAPVAMPETAQ